MAGIRELTAAVRTNDSYPDLPEIAEAYGIELEALTYVCMRRSEMLLGKHADLRDLHALAGLSACWLDGFFAALALAKSQDLTKPE
jgi:hypothetical protein